MKVKASLHIHSNADLTEGWVIGYSVFELIDRAKTLGIQVLAHTCHKYFVWDEAWAVYAREQGILLLSGVELEIMEGGSRNHIVVVNCDASIDTVKTFSDLKKYRQAHPNLLLIAAHPGFGHGASLGYERLHDNWELFDAVENSWFYTSFWNLNRRCEALCREHQKPFIATADLHDFNFECLGTNYAVLDLNIVSLEAVALAVKRGNFVNISQAKSLFYVIKALSRAIISKIIKN